MNMELKSRDIEPLRNTYAHVAHYVGNDKPATRYQEGTLGAQPSQNFHYRPTWDPAHELFDASRSRVKLADWYVLRDPRQYYYATWTMARARQQDAVEANYQFVESRRLLDKLPESLKTSILQVLLPLRHAAWGGNMNNCSIGAYGYGTAFTAPATFHAMDQLGVAQYITKIALAVSGPQCLDEAKSAWMNDPNWQPLRRYVEDTLVLQDPFELYVAQNFALDGQLYPLMFSQFVDEHLSAQGGATVAMLTSFMPEWHEESARWIDAVIKVAAAESSDNQALISGWARAWAARAQEALAPIAQLAWGESSQAELARAWAVLEKRMNKNGV